MAGGSSGIGAGLRSFALEPSGPKSSGSEPSVSTLPVPRPTVPKPADVTGAGLTGMGLTGPGLPPSRLKPVRLMKARRSSTVSCGHWVMHGQRIIKRLGEGWTCLPCAQARRIAGQP